MMKDITVLQPNVPTPLCVHFGGGKVVERLEATGRVLVVTNQLRFRRSGSRFAENKLVLKVFDGQEALASWLFMPTYYFQSYDDFTRVGSLTERLYRAGWLVVPAKRDLVETVTAGENYEVQVHFVDVVTDESVRRFKKVFMHLTLTEREVLQWQSK